MPKISTSGPVVRLSSFLRPVFRHVTCASAGSVFGALLQESNSGVVSAQAPDVTVPAIRSTTGYPHRMEISRSEDKVCQAWYRALNEARVVFL